MCGIVGVVKKGNAPVSELRNVLQSNVPTFNDKQISVTLEHVRLSVIDLSYSQWRVADLASKSVKVLIDGQGPDEMAGGYLYFLPTMWREISLIEKIKYSPDLFLTILHNRHVLKQYPLSLIYERLKGKIASNHKVPLQPEWASKFTDEQPIRRNDSSLNSILRDAIADTSLPALLRYGDRNYMAFGDA